LRDAPTLTDRLLGPLMVPKAESTPPVSVAAPTVAAMALQPDWGQIEQGVVQALQAQMPQWVEKQVFESVVPGFTMLADRLASKAAQEISVQLVQQLQSELAATVHKAVAQTQPDDMLKAEQRPF
jgi:hypothetical protein